MITPRRPNLKARRRRRTRGEDETRSATDSFLGIPLSLSRSRSLSLSRSRLGVVTVEALKKSVILMGLLLSFGLDPRAAVQGAEKGSALRVAM